MSCLSFEKLRAEVIDLFDAGIKNLLPVLINTVLYLSRFHTLLSCFGQNAVPFQLASAFTAARILRNATSASDVWSMWVYLFLFNKQFTKGEVTIIKYRQGKYLPIFMEP